MSENHENSQILKVWIQKQLLINYFEIVSLVVGSGKVLEFKNWFELFLLLAIIVGEDGTVVETLNK